MLNAKVAKQEKSVSSVSPSKPLSQGALKPGSVVTARIVQASSCPDNGKEDTCIGAAGDAGAKASDTTEVSQVRDVAKIYAGALCPDLYSEHAKKQAQWDATVLPASDDPACLSKTMKAQFLSRELTGNKDIIKKNTIKRVETDHRSALQELVSHTPRYNSYFSEKEYECEVWDAKDSYMDNEKIVQVDNEKIVQVDNEKIVQDLLNEYLPNNSYFSEKEYECEVWDAKDSYMDNEKIVQDLLNEYLPKTHDEHNDD